MDHAGALRATNNNGLQPAMDFILEHNDDPIPDSTSGTAAASSAPPHSDPMAEDEDDDIAVLHSAYALSPGASGPGLTDSASSAGVEARVSR
jgi:UBX domain-containing protein 1/4